MSVPWCGAQEPAAPPQAAPAAAGGPHGAALEAAFCEWQTTRWARQDLYAASVMGLTHLVLLWRAGGPCAPQAGPVGGGLQGMLLALARRGGAFRGLIMLALPGLASWAAPGWHRRHRNAVVAASRLGTMVLLHQARQLGQAGAFQIPVAPGGPAAAVASPAWLVVKLAAGSRTVSLAFISLAYPLPLGWLFAVQSLGVCAAAWESWGQLCVLPQLASRGTKQLLLSLAAGMGQAVLLRPIVSSFPRDWPAAAQGLSERGCCLVLALWLQLVVGLAAPLLVRWVLTARARKAFFRARCRRRRCEECAAAKGADVLGTGLALAALLVLLAGTTWDALLAAAAAALEG